MTEAEWLTCSDLSQLRSSLVLGRLWTRQLRQAEHYSSRKQRLFAVACCRQVWHIMTDRRCRRAVEVSERFADGEASQEELSAARLGVRWRQRNTTGYLAFQVADDGAYSVSCDVARLAHEVWVGHDVQGARVSSKAAEQRQLALFRDIVGNPFRPISADTAWVTSVVRTLALGAYLDRDLPRGTLDVTLLAVLADALEDAGCTDADLLEHLRGPGPHIRGCWAVDLLLDRH